MEPKDMDIETAKTIGGLVAKVDWIADTLKEFMQTINQGFVKKEQHNALEVRVSMLENAPYRKRQAIVAWVGALTGVAGVIVAAIAIVLKVH